VNDHFANRKLLNVDSDFELHETLWLAAEICVHKLRF